MVTGNIVIAGPNQGGLAAFNATTGKLFWRNTEGKWRQATGANGVIYVADSSSLVVLNSGAAPLDSACVNRPLASNSTEARFRWMGIFTSPRRPDGRSAYCLRALISHGA